MFMPSLNRCRVSRSSDKCVCMYRYWQCLPETSPAPAPHTSTGRRLQADAVPANAPAPSSAALLPGPQPAPKPALAANYSQCGGAGLTCPLANKTLCKDAQYLDCVPNTHCARLSQWCFFLPFMSNPVYDC